VRPFVAKPSCHILCFRENHLCNKAGEVTQPLAKFKTLSIIVEENFLRTNIVGEGRWVGDNK